MNRMLMGNPVLLKLSLMLSAKTSIESTMASQILIELAEFIFGERQTRMRLSQNGGDSQ